MSCLVPWTQRSTISAFTRVFDALSFFTAWWAAAGAVTTAASLTVPDLRSGMKDAVSRVRDTIRG